MASPLQFWQQAMHERRPYQFERWIASPLRLYPADKVFINPEKPAVRRSTGASDAVTSPNGRQFQTRPGLASRKRVSDFSELNKLVEAIECESTGVEALRHLHELCRLPRNPSPDCRHFQEFQNRRESKNRKRPAGGDAQHEGDCHSWFGGAAEALSSHSGFFSPEEWAKTFAEGLLKNPDLFRGKTLVELGTGSGWISLLMLMRTQALRFLVSISILLPYLSPG